MVSNMEQGWLWAVMVEDAPPTMQRRPKVWLRGSWTRCSEDSSERRAPRRMSEGVVCASVSVTGHSPSPRELSVSRNTKSTLGNTSPPQIGPLAPESELLPLTSLTSAGVQTGYTPHDAPHGLGPPHLHLSGQSFLSKDTVGHTAPPLGTQGPIPL